ncbi:carbohydrate binding domain-containing protein [Hymenobacter sp. BT523]|uniref:carbohydrate binding domain-containing protein n=1 Tax=Hymenobacter sp. BT523 TaxID=2795725 RepID=UPI0018EA868A|nr:carbohydrate binding domain-containing protein [Hymenobacter sp. BT523]
MRLFTYAALALLAAASSCSSKNDSKPDNLLTSNDFESLEGWGVESPSLTREKAHSGQYSIKVQKGIDFSLTYKNLLGKLSPTKINRIKVKAYVLMTKPAGPSLTVQLMKTADDGAEFNQGINLAEVVKKPNEWVEVEKTFTLPPNVAPSNQLRIYMWGNVGDSVVYLDDLEVTIAE